MFKSLRWRLQAWHALILLTVVVGMSLTLYLQIRKARLDEIDGELIAVARVLEGSMRLFPRQVLDRGFKALNNRPQGPPGMASPLPPKIRLERTLTLPEHFTDRYADEEFEPYFVVWLRNGEILKANPSEVKTALQAPPYSANSPPNGPQPRTRDHCREVALFGPESSQILVGRPIDRELAVLNGIAWRLLAAAASVFAIGLLGGWWLSRSIVRPIQMMSATAAGITAANLSWRIDLKKLDDELGVLGQILNSMFDRLQHSFEQQAHFTADASHELRTPLAVILYHAELALSRPRDSAEYRAAFETCLRAANRMKALVDDLLTLARADAGHLELRREPVELRQLVDECVALLDPLARERQVKVSIEGNPLEVHADPDRLAQVVMNLIGNGIRYNQPRGSVKIGVYSDGVEARFTVEDTGVGIAEEHLPHLFDRFYRVDEARSRDSGGSGLGLAICKSIIDAHGGSMKVQSKQKQGTKFTVRLPLS